MTGITGPLRIHHTQPAEHSNSPGVTSLMDDEYTAVWLDPDGHMAKRFAEVPDAAKAMFLAEKQKAHTKRSTRRK